MAIVSLPAIIGYVVRMLIAMRLQRGLRVSLRLFDEAAMRDLIQFGKWFGVLTFARACLPNAATFVIGHVLGPVAVTVFTVPRLLIAYANWIMAALTQVLAPRAAVLHHANAREAQRGLFLGASRYAMAFAVFTVGGLLIFGQAFLRLWQPQLHGLEYLLLAILGLGEILPLSQWIGYNLMISMAKHRFLALVAVAEMAFVIVFGLAAANFSGLLLVAIVTATGAFVFRGVWTAAHVARLLEITAATYAKRSLGPAAVLAAVPVLAFLAASRFWQPQTWVELIGAAIFYVAVFASLGLPVYGWKVRLIADVVPARMSADL